MGVLNTETYEPGIGVGPQQAFELTTQTLKKVLILALKTLFLGPGVTSCIGITRRPAMEMSRAPVRSSGPTG